jgi:integrase
MTARRHRLRPGERGDVWVTDVIDRETGEVLGHQARVRVRDRDGRVRQVSARAATKGAARRALDRKLELRSDPGSVGVVRGMTVKDLGEYWMKRREQDAAAPEAGQGRGGPIAPQTLAAYRSAFDNVIVPALGGLRLPEATVGILDDALADIERRGRSTAQARTVLLQMFALAVRHGALPANPMRDVSRPRRRRKQVEALTVQEACALIAYLDDYCRGHALDRHGRRAGGRRRDRSVLELVVFLLATGTRIGEALAVRNRDVDLRGTPPTVHVCGTLVEPRKDYVAQLHRQAIPKGRENRTLILPDAAVAMLSERRKRTTWRRLDDPVFASLNGNWLWPNNQRTRLRKVLAGSRFADVEPHTFRRTVGTLLTHEAGVDVARDFLGHSDPSVTFQHYTGPRLIAPDVRYLLDRFFAIDAPGCQAGTGTE